MTVAHLRDLPVDSLCEIAFSGRSNAGGKSSAINTLAGRTRLAREQHARLHPASLITSRWASDGISSIFLVRQGPEAHEPNGKA